MISEIRALPNGVVSLEHEANSDFYYVLYRGDDLFAILDPEDIALGFGGFGELFDTPPPTGSFFYRVLKVPKNDPLDTDGDGINDMYELSFSTLMSPLNPNDATQDPDLDGLTNREEAKNGTDPSVFTGVRLTTPLPGTTLGTPANISLAAATDETIVRVEFFEGLKLLSEDTSGPFSAVWNNVSAGDYFLMAVGYDAGNNPIVSKAVPVTVNIAEPQLAVSATATRDTTVQLTGFTVPNGIVTVAGGLQTFVGQAANDGTVDMAVPLHLNKLNRLFVTVTDSGGRTTSPLPFEVLHDGVPPTLFIDFPPSEVDQIVDSVVVAGRVGDMLSGFMGLNVTVNGQPANVVVGIGQNGTYERGAVSLVSGINEITVVATDALGNSTTKIHRLNRTAATGARLASVSGDGQAGMVRNKLPQPVVVKVLTESGDPFPNKLVTFDVSRSDGRLSSTSDPDDVGKNMYQAFTDANGLASTFWTMGNDSGCGNNRITVTSKGITGTVFFCASADAEPASQINIGSGNNLKAEAGSLSPEPMVAWVNDSCNGAVGVPVTFTVIEGDGLVNGQTSVTIPTTMTGHATIAFRLGFTPGNNRVQADFPGNPGNPAVFVIQGVARDLEKPTSYGGMVLSNARLPIQGAVCVLEVEGEQVGFAISGPDGRFNMINVPAGPAHLKVDGYPATAVAGLPIAEGTYPALAYETLVIPNAENSLPVPVLLPPLNPVNAREYDGTADVELTVEEIAGLKMTVKAGSMTLKDGTKPSPGNPATLTLNQVHHDDIPMPMPDGASPPFAWTLQPAGATFDPPVDIEYPNMSSLPAGAIAYFLSFNHDTEAFEIVATGHVEDDGSKIVTDPGVGLTVAGWGCNCPPYSVTSVCTNSVGGTRVRDPETETQGPPNCTKTCLNNGSLIQGTSSPSSPVVCVGQSVSFNPPTVTDTGGTNITVCTFPDGTTTTNLTSIAPGGVRYLWVLYRNGVLVQQGTGSPATVPMNVSGNYTCTWLALPTRTECPPSAISLPTQSATVIGAWSLSGGGVTSTTATPGPTETIRVCEGLPGQTVSLVATSTHGNWPAGQPIWVGANGSGSSATFPIHTPSTNPDGDLVQVICGGSVKAIRILVVAVDSVSGEGIVSKTNFPLDPETIYACKGNTGDKITLTAHSNGNGWPPNEPKWIVDGVQVGTGATYQFPVDTASTKDIGSLVTVRCDQSEKSIAVIVVDVDQDIFQAASANASKTMLPEDSEEAPGLFLCVNADDDDNDKKPDKDDGQITGDAAQRTADMKDMAELVMRRLKPPGLAEGKVYLKKLSGAGVVRIFKKSDRSLILTTSGAMSSTTDAQGTALRTKLAASEETYLVEGVTPGELELALEYKKGMTVCRDIIKIKVVRIEFNKLADCIGFDDSIQPPWLMVPLPAGGTNVAKMETATAAFAPMVDLDTAHPAIATVSPAKPAGSPQTITVTSVAKGETQVRAKAEDALCAILGISVKPRITRTIKIHAITEENDDVQVIAVGKGQPNAHAIFAGGNLTIDTTVAGDDQLIGQWITTGADGICQTAATGDDVTLIQVGKGLPGAICVSAGTNTKRDTKKNGDDILSGQTIITGVDGICDTAANATNGPAPATAPTAADLQAYLNDVTWGKQANVFFTVTRQDHVKNYDLDLDGKLDDPHEIPGVGRKVPKEWGEVNEVRTLKDTTVDYNIYYVQAYEYPIGLTEMDEVFSDASGLNTPVNHTAHEVGHLLGRPNESNDVKDVMYKSGLSTSPCRITKIDWDIANP